MKVLSIHVREFTVHNEIIHRTLSLGKPMQVSPAQMLKKPPEGDFFDRIAATGGVALLCSLLR
jgi:hypothetical protein